jgi:Flp pilus assembly protein TadG
MLVKPRTERLSREAGQVVVLFAIMLPVFLGLGAVVLDIGNWYVHKRHLQTQVDAAAFAAASGFSSCFFNPTSANLSIANTALSYAGDTARNPTARNQQVQTPGNVRVTLNSQRYWAAGDPTTATSNGYGTAVDPVGDNSAGTPCATSTLDVKATDFDAPKLFSWLGIRPDIKAHARLEIHSVKEESGFLPLAVPEIDPNFVYAIFVDYSKNGTQIPLRVQELQKDAAYGGPTFPYSAWVPNTAIPNNTQVTLHPDSTYSDGTGVVILVSKADTAPSKSGTLNQICNQTPTDLVQCYAGTGTAGYDGAATGQGLSYIHSFDASPAIGPLQPLLRDVNVTSMVCTGGVGSGNLVSPPYFVNDDNDCTVAVTVKVDFGQAPAPGKDPGLAPNKGGFCAQVTGLSGATWTGTSGNVSTFSGTMSVSVASGPNPLTLGFVTKFPAIGTNCSGSVSGSFGRSSMVYSTDDNSGPVGYVKLTANGPNGTTACPSATGVADANSTYRGNYCYSVAVGLDQPLALKPWSSPSIVLRFASKSTRKGGSGTANLNGSLLCDAGRTLVDSFSSGCYTTYGLNYDKWGTAITPACTPGAKCWKDVLCSAYPPSSLPPASYVNNPPPICVAAKNGQVQAFQSGIYNRFEDPANGFGGCSANNWPTTQAQADQFFKDPDDGGYDFTNDPRYITLIITDNTAFSSSNTAEPVKYFAGFYATGWDSGNGAGKPSGCYGFPPSAGTCGNPNNDAHPFLGCLAGKTISSDNGDMWGHFVKFVSFSSSGTPSDDVCDLTSASVETCVAVLVE